MVQAMTKDDRQPTAEGLELARRHAALMYRKRRRALYRGRLLGLPAEILREVRRQVINWRAAWLAARFLSTSQEQ